MTTPAPLPLGTFLTALILLLGALFPAFAQKAVKDEAAVRACLLDYADGISQGDTARQARAFHPVASMKYTDAKTHELVDVPIADFLNRLKASAGKKIDRKTTINYIHIQGTAAQAALEIEGDTYIFHDYMNLLKINGQWRIVSKIFSRVDKSTPKD